MTPGAGLTLPMHDGLEGAQYGPFLVLIGSGNRSSMLSRYAHSMLVYGVAR